MANEFDAYKKGDLVRYTSKFLRNIQWHLDVPIDGRVEGISKFRNRQLLTILWNTADESIQVPSDVVEMVKAQGGE